MNAARINNTGLSDAIEYFSSVSPYPEERPLGRVSKDEE
jgi:hypothetical protein